MSMSSSMHYLACSKEDDVINAFDGSVHGGSRRAFCTTTSTLNRACLHASSLFLRGYFI